MFAQKGKGAHARAYYPDSFRIWHWICTLCGTEGVQEYTPHAKFIRPAAYLKAKAKFRKPEEEN